MKKPNWIDELRREAVEECDRCQGRVHGDCSSACRYWELTASQEEVAEEGLLRAKKWIRHGRGWLGAVSFGVEQSH